MTALEFDPKDAHKGQKAIFAALVTMSDVVERPLRRVSLPEMPASTRAEVNGRIHAAISVMSTARSGVAGVATELKQRAQNAGVYDRAAKLPWWVGVGDAAMTGASFFGFDAVHKTVSGDYSKKEVAVAWAAFGTNFIPVVKIAKAIKGVRGATKAAGHSNRAVGKLPAGAARPASPTALRPAVPTAATPPKPSPTRPVISRPTVGPATRPRPMGTGAAHIPPVKPPKPAPPKLTVVTPGGTAGSKPVGPSKPWVPNDTGASQAAAAADIALTGATPVHVAAQQVSAIVRNPEFGLSAGSTWLHTGGQRLQAATLAHAAGGSTIEMTHAGTRVNLQFLYSKFPKDVADAYWEKLSRKLIESSSGVVNALAATTVSPTSVFARIEVPALVKNPKVPQLVVHRSGAGTATVVTKIRRSDPAAAKKIVEITNHNPNAKLVFDFVP